MRFALISKMIRQICAKLFCRI